MKKKYELTELFGLETLVIYKADEIQPKNRGLTPM